MLLPTAFCLFSWFERGIQTFSEGSSRVTRRIEHLTTSPTTATYDGEIGNLFSSGFYSRPWAQPGSTNQKTKETWFWTATSWLLIISIHTKKTIIHPTKNICSKMFRKTGADLTPRRFLLPLHCLRLFPEQDWLHRPNDAPSTAPNGLVAAAVQLR